MEKREVALTDYTSDPLAFVEEVLDLKPHLDVPK